jgi:hypothetical protein
MYERRLSVSAIGYELEGSGVSSVSNRVRGIAALASIKATVAPAQIRR